MGIKTACIPLAVGQVLSNLTFVKRHHEQAITKNLCDRQLR